MSVVSGIDFDAASEYPATELAAGTPIDFTAPHEGFVVGLRVIVQTAIVTGGVVTLKIGTTDVPGVSITVPDAATKGTVLYAAATAGADNRKALKGQRMQLVASAAFNGGGALGCTVEMNSSSPNPA